MSENHVNTIVMCIVDLGVTKESKMELGVVCDLSLLLCAAVCVWFCCPRNPLTPRHGSGFTIVLHVLSHVVLGPLSDVTHLTPYRKPEIKS